ncbi:MAG: cytochrome P450 [Acidimicrobiales bacterium]|nr:cytochrome P450 [Acidimicrobiales bacterium]
MTDYDPFNPANTQDPYPIYKRMREEAPVWRGGMYNEVFLSRHADITAVLRDAERFSSDSANLAPELRAMNPSADDVNQGMMAGFLGGKIMLFSDPPDHTRLRRLASHAFTPRAIEKWRPRIRSLVEEMLSQFGPGDEFDVMDVLARPLPVVVIAELLGVPLEDQEKFAGWSTPLARMIDPDSNMGPDDYSAAISAAMQFVSYFNALIEERRGAPRDDVLSTLIAAEEEGDRLTHEELLINLILLLIAGHETTSNLIGNGALALCENPSVREEFAAAPDDLARTTVDEFLRYDAPVQFTVRTALDDVRFDNETVTKGHQVLLLLAGANRDPAAFDRPDDVVLSRTQNNHLAFSNGIHFCLGAMLAKMEGQESFPALIKRFPKLERRGDLIYRPNMTLRGLAELTVTG